MKTLFYWNRDFYKTACKGKNPLECFYCKDRADVIQTIESNKRHWIECRVIDLDNIARKYDELRRRFNKGEITLDELARAYYLL